MKKRQDTGFTTEQAMALFIRDKENVLSPASVESYRIAMQRFLPVCPTNVCDISQTTISEFVNLLTKQSIRSTSINHYLTSIRAFVNYCYKCDYIKSKVNVSLLKSQEEMVKFYDDDELQILLVKPKTDDFLSWRNYAIICTLLGTGARASTLINMHISDIDLKSNVICYRHTKNKKLLNAPISQQLAKVLHKYINDWERETDRDYLFPTCAEQQLTVNGMYQALHDYCTSRGVDFKGIHSFRHTFARTYIRHGGNVFVLQQILGHQTLEMTRHYVTLFSEDCKKDIEQYAALDLFTAQSKQSTIKHK